MILLLLAVYFNDYDFSLSQDKIGHFAMGYTVSSVSYSLYLNFDGDRTNTILGAVATSALIGIWKEGYDYQKTGKASLGDLVYTIAGGFVGSLISNYLFGKCEVTYEWK